MSQVRQLVIVAVSTVLVAAIAALAVGASTDAVLTWTFVGSLAMWLGGAVSGQILLARLLDEDLDGYDVRVYLSLLLWLIPRFYVPLGLVAVAAATVLLLRHDESLWQVNVALPALLYVLLSVAGAAISAPGYTKLMRDADSLFGAANAAGLRVRLLPLAWLNRIELVLAVGLGGILLSQFA